jgi:hypothetical protein
VGIESPSLLCAVDRAKFNFQSLPCLSRPGTNTSWRMIEKAGKTNHGEDEPITKMQIGSSSRLIVNRQPLPPL